MLLQYNSRMLSLQRVFSIAGETTQPLLDFMAHTVSDHSLMQIVNHF